MNEAQQKIYDFCRENPFGAVATASNSGDPAIAAVFIFAKPDFTFNFLTRSGTRKGDNINANPKAALETVNAGTFETVQIQGTVQRVEGSEEGVDLANLYVAAYEAGKAGSESRSEQRPDVTKWIPPVTQIQQGEYVLFKVTPTWARYRKYDNDKTAAKGFTEFEYKVEG